MNTAYTTAMHAPLTPDQIDAMIDAIPAREWDSFGPAEAYHRAVRDMQARARLPAENDAKLHQIARDLCIEFGFPPPPDRSARP